ncbi:MAG: hypothetical protein Q7K11_00075 [Candidatus Berkelbacteria bacterium]|nr:hypothetical protein [Candidatus Berkelbacteria bacterium]
MRDQKKIIAEIRILLDELDGAPSIKSSPHKSINNSEPAISQKGALGAINMLMAENFFDTPKEMPVVMERLKEIGHYHKRTAIAMNLLNLTKRRILNRFKNKETKNWEYVIRK